MSQGYFVWCVAENELNNVSLDNRLREIYRDMKCIDSSVENGRSNILKYGAFDGMVKLKRELARYWNSRIYPLSSRVVNETNLILTTGAGCAIESFIFSVCNPGEGVIIPSPFYSAFPLDTCARTGCCLYVASTSPVDDYHISIASLEEAFHASNNTAKVLLLTNPTNPLGSIISMKDMMSYVEWARGKGLHVLVDEIYASCILDDGKIDGGVTFESMASVDMKDDVHIIWGVRFMTYTYSVDYIYSNSLHVCICAIWCCYSYRKISECLVTVSVHCILIT